MMFVASQIAAWIVVAALLGFSIGWVARGRRSSRRVGRRF